MIPAETVDISKMGPWDFLARVRSLGLSESDRAALINGTVTPEIQARAEHVAEVAKSCLILTTVARPS